MKDRHFCTGSFTYILTAQWDVVSPKMIKRYQVNPFSCGMNERVNMKEAIRLILQEDKWTPYESVQDIADFYNAQEPFPFMEEEKKSHRPLYKEYLYFNKNVRQLMYNCADMPDAHAETETQKRRRIESFADAVCDKKHPVAVFERKNAVSEYDSYYYLVRLVSEGGNANAMKLVIYRLPLSSIQLRLYCTGILSLAIRCCNEFNAENSCYEKATLAQFGPEPSEGGNNPEACSFSFDAVRKSVRDCVGKIENDRWTRCEDERDIAWIQDAGRRLFLPRGVYDYSVLFDASDPNSEYRVYKGYPSETPVYSALAISSLLRKDKNGGRGREEIEWTEIINMLPYMGKVTRREMNVCLVKGDWRDDNKLIAYRFPLSDLGLRFYEDEERKPELVYINVKPGEVRTVSWKTAELDAQSDIERADLQGLEWKEPDAELRREHDEWGEELGKALCGNGAFRTEAGFEDARRFGIVYAALCDGEKQIEFGSQAQEMPAGAQVPEEDNEKRKLLYPEHLLWTESLIASNCMSEKVVKRCKIAKHRQNLMVIDCFNDDRMYLHGSVVSKDISEATRQAFNALYGSEGGCTREHFMNLSKWYGIMAADYDWSDATCHSNKKLIELVEKATELRWSDYSTFYALTYHSLVSLAGCGAPEYLTENMDWIYFQMFLIAILQRCSLQRFYREAAGVMQIREKGERGKCRRALKEIYMLFLNRIWFNEVTEQEQGREMFLRLQQNMDIEQDVEFLDKALEELHEWEQKRLESTVNNQLLPLSIIGGIGSAVGLLFADWPGIGGGVQKLLSKGVGKCVFRGLEIGVTGVVAAAVVYYMGKFIMHLLNNNDE